ncbi:MAG TPA: CAAX prenyl protease-related protein [Lacipirellulaceae bacterium]|nr:CAAX prenyl protease-related protein [Lacipirellulaceae bacterium]
MWPDSAHNPWLTFLLPFIVYMVVGSFEPAAPKPPHILPNGRAVPATNNNWFGLEYRQYPTVYTVKIALTIAAMIFVLPGYRQFRLRVSVLAIIVGVVGIVIWVGICHLQMERALLAPIGLDKLLGLGARPSFNPLTELAATPVWAYTFLAIRFLGLAIVVPIIEEFFLRGCLMRFAIRENFWTVPFGTLTPAAAVIGTVVPMLMHPAELFAAAVWFSLVTWLMWRTRNIWDCVAAHAVTNLLLGIYVVSQHQWQLW